MKQGESGASSRPCTTASGNVPTPIIATLDDSRDEITEESDTEYPSSNNTPSLQIELLRKILATNEAILSELRFHREIHGKKNVICETIS